MAAPSQLHWNQMIELYAVVTVFLIFKHFILLIYSADVSQHPTEDFEKGYGALVYNCFIYLFYWTSSTIRTYFPNLLFNYRIIKPETPVPDDIKRRSRALANDLENIPIHLSVFILAFVVQNLVNMTGQGFYGTWALSVLFPMYAGFRTIFTVCYLRAIQPLRTVAFLFANLTVFTTGAILLYSAFIIDVGAFSK